MKPARRLPLARTAILGAIVFAPAVMAQAEDIAVAGAAVTTELTGTVEIVNQETRMLTIKTPDGRFEVIRIPKEVQRLDQIKIGNRLTISETEAVLVDLQKGPDAGSVSMTKESVMEREPGVKPAGSIIDTLTLNGRIESVDKANSTVTVRGPRQTLTLNVSDPALLDSLAPGDGVSATYIRVLSGEVQYQ